VAVFDFESLLKRLPDTRAGERGCLRVDAGKVPAQDEPRPEQENPGFVDRHAGLRVGGTPSAVPAPAPPPKPARPRKPAPSLDDDPRWRPGELETLEEAWRIAWTMPDGEERGQWFMRLNRQGYRAAREFLDLYAAGQRVVAPAVPPKPRELEILSLAWQVAQRLEGEERAGWEARLEGEGYPAAQELLEHAGTILAPEILRWGATQLRAVGPTGEEPYRRTVGVDEAQLPLTVQRLIAWMRQLPGGARMELRARRPNGEEQLLVAWGDPR